MPKTESDTTAERQKWYCEDFKKANPTAVVRCCDSCHEDDNLGYADLPEDHDWQVCCRWLNWMDTPEGQKFMAENNIRKTA